MRGPCCQFKHCLRVVTRRNKEQKKRACYFKSRLARESQRAAHSLQACLRLARPPLPAWVAPAELAAPRVLDLAALAAPRVLDLAALAPLRVLLLAQLAVLVVRLPQRVLRALVLALVTLFLERLILAWARVLTSQRPSMAAPDSATE